MANGSTFDPPSHLTYVSVIFCDRVRIMFFIVVLNATDIWAGDITIAFIRAPTTEKVFIRCCDVFRPELKNIVRVIIRAIYGLKTTAASFRQHLSDCMELLGFEPCEADPNAYYRHVERDGEKLYEYILLYVDDVLVISNRGHLLFRLLENTFP